MMKIRHLTWTILIGLALVAATTADAAITINIDFEGDISDLYYVNGWKTKSPSISGVTDAPAGSSGVQSAHFRWASDGANTNMFAYMVKDLDQAYDFSNALMSYWHKRTNRSNMVGVALFDNGQLAARWEVPMSQSWAQAIVDVANDAPTATGAGSLASITAVAFLHRNTGTPGSGLNHEVRFDDFVATGVVPEPVSLLLLAAGAGLLARRRCQ